MYELNTVLVVVLVVVLIVGDGEVVVGFETGAPEGWSLSTGGVGVGVVGGGVGVLVGETLGAAVQEGEPETPKAGMEAGRELSAS